MIVVNKILEINFAITPQNTQSQLDNDDLPAPRSRLSSIN